MNEGYLLDTNIPSELTKPAADPRVASWVSAHDKLHISVITIGELRRGFSLLPLGGRRIRLEQWYEQALLPLIAERILPITQAIADRWGILSAESQLRGRHLGLADGLIAATAIEHELTLVTRNVKDFVGLGLTIFNPWD